MQSPLKFIAIDGPIGVGKTTLSQMLCEEFRGFAIMEPSDKNPFLADFYKNKEKNAFKTQLFFLLNRFQQQVELKQYDMLRSPIICDYTFAKDAIFAHINLSEDEYNLYQTIYKLLKEKLSKPDIVIYLQAEPKIILQRIKKRGIDYEKSITEDYLSKLIEAYNQYFTNYKETPLLVVDTTSTNYLENPLDFQNLKREILNHRGGTSHFIAR